MYVLTKNTLYKITPIKSIVKIKLFCNYRKEVNTNSDRNYNGIPQIVLYTIFRTMSSKSMISNLLYIVNSS